MEAQDRIQELETALKELVLYNNSFFYWFNHYGNSHIAVEKDALNKVKAVVKGIEDNILKVEKSKLSLF